MGNKKKPIIALMYDFDKTLCGKDMQDYSFIPSIGMNSSEFWQEANKLATKTNMDKILAYMYLMIKTAKKNDVPITREAFTKLGEEVVLLKGVKGWFERINAYGKVYDVEFLGGCNGNLQGIGKLVEGMEVDEVISRLEGIRCGMKPTSCPDQLATALKKAKEEN